MQKMAYTVSVERVAVQLHQTDSTVPTSMTRSMLDKGSENESRRAMFSDMTESTRLPNRSTTA